MSTKYAGQDRERSATRRAQQEEFLNGLRSTFLNKGEAGVDGAPGSGIEAISEMLETEIRIGIDLRWPELRAVKIVLDEVAEEFEGEDVLPEHRAALNAAKAGVESINLFLANHRKAPVELVEPEEQMLDDTRALIERAAK